MKRGQRFLPFVLATALLACAIACRGSSGSDGGRAASVSDDDASSNDDDDDDDHVLPDDDQSPDDDDNDAFACNVAHPDSTVGLISCRPGAFGGYTLFAPAVANTVYLIDMFGHVVNAWTGPYWPGLSVYLLEDGQLLRTGNTINENFDSGGQGGVVMLQDWDGAIAWSYLVSDAHVCSHHDVRRLPNGNILMIVWEKKTPAEAAAAGRDPNSLPGDELWPDYYVEITPEGTDGAKVVWEWHAWDHLVQDYDPAQANYGVVADHPEWIDVNYGTPRQTDWLHTNGIDYNAQYDQILVSVRNFSEVWVIDHSTTTAEAATHSGGVRGRGGDLLYRWGNPGAYRQDGAPRDLYYQHNGQWIAPGLPGAGHLLVFNNGVGRPAGNYSSADEFAPDVNADGSYPAPDPTYGPEGLSWTFVDAVPADMFSAYYSGVQRLANGNTLICVGGTAVFMEVTAAGAVVWQYVSPVTDAGVAQQGQHLTGGANTSFRANRYPPDYPGFVGQNLTPGPCLVPPCN